MIRKEDLQGRIEAFIHAGLRQAAYERIQAPARSLITWNRFDLGFKLAYLDLRPVLPDLAREIYYYDIRAQTLGAFVEPGDEEKNSFDRYVERFDATFHDIGRNGFDAGRTLLPLSAEGGIVNGAHRLASAAYLGRTVEAVRLDVGMMVGDYRYFHDRDVPAPFMDMAANYLIEFADDLYIAFLWPSGRRNLAASEALFENVAYKTRIMFTRKGALNLLYELYQHMDWIGDAANGYDGLHLKRLECFPAFDPVTVIVFQAADMDAVRAVKSRVRDINGLGFSSIHITDTKEEAVRLGRLLFSHNGRHFLNHADPYKFPACVPEISAFAAGAQGRAPDLNRMVVDGSKVLELYGLRRAHDLDGFSMEPPDIRGDAPFPARDEQLAFHEVGRESLIFDPAYYFRYMGVKFVSFEQIYRMKRRRDEPKDRNDGAMMKAMMRSRPFLLLLVRARQGLLYRRMVWSRYLRGSVKDALSHLGLYNFVRRHYRALKGYEADPP